MDEIEDITRFYPEYTINDSIYRNVSVTTNENIGTEYATGLNLFSSIPVTSKLSLRGNMMLFHNYVRVEQSEDLISTGFRFRGNLNATWQLPRKLVVEAFGFYRSGGKDIQGKEPHFYIYNFAFRKLLWGGNGSFGLTATNVFSRDIKQVSTTATGNSASKSVRMLPFRSFGVSFTYKFGKMQQKNQDRGDESESIGGGGD
jgi:outer membrane receptor for ferrienterochelin and colicin